MESIDPANLKDVNKGFNKPGEYAAVLERLGIDATSTRSHRLSSVWTTTLPESPSALLAQVRTWPPGLPIFGLLTPLPATPLYKRLEKAGPAHAPQTLAGVHPVCDGAHAAEDDH
jgi:hypothetical protein